MSEAPNNLQLWDSVRTPDPTYTKDFTRTGGFKGTATNPTYLIRRATELWGPIGGNWGPDIVDERYVDGAPIVIDGNVVGHEKLHTIRINLRYPGGVVPGYGQTMFVSKNKWGAFTDEEAPKKSLTDAMTKALSWLGFAADIHLGMWEDNKYVADVREQFADDKPASQKRTTKRTGNPEQSGQQHEGGKPWYAGHLAAIQNATDAKRAGAAWEFAKKEARNKNDVPAYNALKEAAEAASAKFNQPAQPKEGNQ
jgi:hypothetical protein